MKKLTKKQMIIGGTIAVLLVGTGTVVGVVNHNNAIHAQQVAKTKAHEAKVKADKKAKAEKLAKEKEAAQQKQVASLLSTATANPSDKAIKAVNDAIAKLTDQKEKTKDVELVKGLTARLTLIKKAEAAVKDYQAHATDANKQKAAQEAINNLKDKNDEDVKAQLQKLFDESNKQAQEAAKASQATNQATSEVKESSSSNSNASANVNQAASQTQSNTNASEFSQGGTYTYQAPATNSQQYVSGNTNSNNSGTASGYASSNTPSGNTNTGGSTSGGTVPSHPGGYGSIEDLNKQEKEAGNAGTGNAINKQPGAKW